MMWTLLQISGFSVFIAAAPLVHAAQILKIKEQTLLIQLDEFSASAKPGQFYIAIDTEGTRKGILRLEKIGKARAVATLIKGQAEPGWTLQSAETLLNQKNDSYSAVGFILGLTQASVDVSIVNGSTTTEASLDGQAYSLRGFYSLPVFSQRFQIRAAFGLDRFEVEGAVNNLSCNGTNQCTIEISYLISQALAQYYFLLRTWNLWIGAGAGYTLPLSKAATAVVENSIEGSFIYTGALGLNFQIQPKYFIPVQFEYNYLPSSSEVDANYMTLSVGFGYNF